MMSEGDITSIPEARRDWRRLFCVIKAFLGLHHANATMQSKLVQDEKSCEGFFVTAIRPDVKRGGEDAGW